MAKKLKCIKCLKDEVLFQRQKIVSETKMTRTIDSMYKCFNCGAEQSVRCYNAKGCEDVKPLVGAVSIGKDGEIVYE